MCARRGLVYHSCCSAWTFSSKTSRLSGWKAPVVPLAVCAVAVVSVMVNPLSIQCPLYRGPRFCEHLQFWALRNPISSQLRQKICISFENEKKCHKSPVFYRV